mmetsp:Transcript_58546/g.188116  ORF Transcript_58546/g.188116 Transcript_58546/m.188116 type:complete len:236 (-) Transcript_58546:59-766(-)
MPLHTRLSSRASRAPAQRLWRRPRSCWRRCGEPVWSPRCRRTMPCSKLPWRRGLGSASSRSCRTWRIGGCSGTGRRRSSSGASTALPRAMLPLPVTWLAPRPSTRPTIYPLLSRRCQLVGLRLWTQLLARSTTGATTTQPAPRHGPGRWPQLLWRRLDQRIGLDVAACSSLAAPAFAALRLRLAQPGCDRRLRGGVVAGQTLAAGFADGANPTWPTHASSLPLCGGAAVALPERL